MGIDPLPTYTPPLELPETAPELAARFPLVLISSPRHYFLNSTFVNIESLRKNAEPECVLHAADAERRGIAEGARVVVFNGRGEFTAVARVGDQVREGVVWAPSIWWAKLAPDGTNANATTSQRETDMGRGPVSVRQSRRGRARGLSAILHVQSNSRIAFQQRSIQLQSYPSTLGALKRSSYGAPAMQRRSVKDELRQNLLNRICAGGPLFQGVLGYEDTVMPQIVNAVLSKHNFILLGLRGQAKSRILRALTTLLDEAIPIIDGSEVNDNPFAPVSKFGRLLLEEAGDDTPIAWLDRDSRYVEKLATPDVTIADLIGDLDPIKAARGGHVLADELTMHYGMLPRANRGIFALNELPDLAGKVQVGLFNIMQEGDVQIKGYPVRLPLDVLLCFTANPEDYTARGKIITPLKDRIGSEIQTHYPETVEIGMSITRQEAWTGRGDRQVRIPDFIGELVERVAFEARTDKRIDRRSGVSQRMPITRDREHRVERGATDAAHR